LPALMLLLLLLGPGAAAAELRVAVAANFKPTLAALTPLFEQQSGHRVILSSAATGVLHNQIRHGAPFDLFLSADRERAVLLEALGHSAGSSFCYARGQLALVGGGFRALANPDYSLAIANPATAPYGTAALAVLARPEFAGAAGRRLVRGANVAQAYQFWHSGSVSLALVPLALAPGGLPVPLDWHAPLLQFAVPLRASEALSAYLAWLRSDTVKQLIQNAGYQPCP
jgi:molybdate transport system substrate-binding protein